ncbi:MAG: esterase-like activity of phytase family protein, partial [Ferruginibacter sp.]
MYQLFLRTLSFIAVILISFSCASTKRATQPIVNISSLKYVGGYEIPYNLKYKNTIVGGLSGIDYDAKNDLYYLISDDRSDKNPARFYKAKIFISKKGIDSLAFTDVASILQPGGDVYPNNLKDRSKTPDPEAIRYNPKKDYLVWSSEGERIVKANDTMLTDPSVIIIKSNGKYVDSFALPVNLKMRTTEKGPRRNGVFEGITFADDYKTLYVNVEEPLYEDGPRADVVDNDAFIRIIKFDVMHKKSTAQYAYKLAPVAFSAKPENEFKINGVPDILSLGNSKLLVIERSFSTGRLACTIRVFIADLNGATDISTITLKNNDSFVPAKKSLLLNMDDLGIYTDNIEGVT